MAEITLKGAGGNDFYDISNVDGFSIPLSITPTKKSKSGGEYYCKTADCPNDIKAGCPDELQDKNKEDKVVGCKSACIVYGKPEYCCSESHNTPAKCPPNKYSKYFKKMCPNAYSYAYDDKTSTFQCKDTDYTIQFC